MPDEEISYGLFSRGDLAMKSNAEGTGIGLYIAKKVTNLLNGSIEYKSNRISDFYIPYLHKYISYDHTETDDKEMLLNVKSEYKKLQCVTYTSEQTYPVENHRNMKCVYTDVVNSDVFVKSFDKIPKARVLDKINEPTYKITFEVVI